MNENFEKLKEKATTYEEHAYCSEFGYHTHEQFDLEKFAELIVRETLQLALAGAEYGPGIAEAVYKYFGVEE